MEDGKLRQEVEQIMTQGLRGAGSVTNMDFKKYFWGKVFES